MWMALHSLQVHVNRSGRCLTSSCLQLTYKKYIFFLVGYINFLYLVFLNHYTVFKMSFGLFKLTVLLYNVHTFLIYV